RTTLWPSSTHGKATARGLRRSANYITNCSPSSARPTNSIELRRPGWSTMWKIAKADVAHALLRAASRLFSTPVQMSKSHHKCTVVFRRREESRRGTQECVCPEACRKVGEREVIVASVLGDR